MDNTNNANNVITCVCRKLANDHEVNTDLLDVKRMTSASQKETGDADGIYYACHIK